MKRVYIAGKLNDPAVDYIKNVHRMLVLADQARRAGFAVFVPCLDLLLGVTAGDYEYSDYAENNLIWLEAAEAVLVEPRGAHGSKGTRREIVRANELGIPVFWSVEAMQEWRDGKR